MLLLLDENIGVEIQKMLFEYDTKSIRDMGWLGKKNGELMRLIAENDFDIFISTDKNLPYQQNLSRNIINTHYQRTVSTRLTIQSF